MATEFFNLSGNLEAVRRYAGQAGSVLELRVTQAQWKRNTCLHEAYDDGKLISRTEVEKGATVVPITAHRLNAEARDLELWAEEHKTWEQADWAKDEAINKRNDAVSLVRNSLHVC